MKKIIEKLSYFAIFLLIATQLSAQNSHIRSQGYYTLGLNGGWAYQQSDAKASFEGYGLGLTLAKNLYYKAGAPLTFDLRGRLLYANTYGLDGTRSYGIENNTAVNGANGIDYSTDPGFVYYNHNTKIGELALEGVFHLNRLRENTQFDVSLFGGIGLDYYSTKNNWLGVNGNYATDFSAIDISSPSSNTRNSLLNVLDDSYETRADGFENGGKINIMPSLGVELYYWFTPKFALGLGHKATWARSDDLDGQQWNSENLATAENDLYHYTHLGAKWIIEPGRRRVLEPMITIIDPQINPFPSPTPEGFVRAEIQNVDADEVTCRINGRNSKFRMNGENFSVNFPLREGRNEVVITASNAAGRAQETQIITFENTYTPPPPPRGDRPYISFTNPPERNHNVSAADFTVRAIVENINRSGDIQVTFNGQRVRNFNYNQNKLSFPVTLKTGKNEVIIRAKNNEGDAKEEAFVYYEVNTPAQNPSVYITRPNTSPFNSNQKKVRVEAEIENITGRKDIKFYINGRASNNFEYNANNGRLISEVTLNNGSNKVYIEAKGPGNASDQVTIIYKDAVNIPTPPANPSTVLQKPNVRITAVPTPRASDCQTTVKAVITNVSTYRDISFKVNGQRVNKFEYNPNTDQFTSTINVRPGQNTIRIDARNSAGKENDSRSVTCSGSVIGDTGGNTNPNTQNNTKPSVTITTPSKQSTTTNEAQASIKATIKAIDSKNDITFLVNGQRMSNFTYSTSTDKFSANITLKTGNNDIIIKAVNKYGKGEDNAAIRYIRQIGTPTTPKPPTVTITKPSNNSTVTTASVQVKATIKNMSSKNGISLTVNGKNISNFSYSNSILTATTNLQAGNNAIIVKAKNSDGQDEARVNVKYTAATLPPTVAFTSPRNNANVETASQKIKATVRNAKKENLIFTLNGSKISNFSLSGSSFVATVNLKKGQNKLRLVANVGSQSDAADLTINYKETVAIPKPTVRFTAPSRTGQKISEGYTTVKATIQNVKDRSSLVFKLNNGIVKRFNYDKGVLSASVNLKEGKNTFQIIATNESGSTTANSSITYEKVVISKPPTVKINSASQPAIDPMNPGIGRSTIIATIKNVTNKNQITFTINGSQSTNFEFKPRSGEFKTIIDLERGDNKIIIKASNIDGVAQDSRNIEF